MGWNVRGVLSISYDGGFTGSVDAPTHHQEAAVAAVSETVVEVEDHALV